MQRIRRQRVKEEPFNYLQYGLTENDIPEFSRFVFHRPYLPNKEKQAFLDEFLLEYIKNPDYKKEVDGKKLLFTNESYLGVYDINVVGYDVEPKGAKITVPIGKVLTLGGYTTKCIINV